MIATLDLMQLRLGSERCNDGPEMAEIGKPVARALQEQHGDRDTGKVLGALAGRLLVGMEGKPRKASPLTPGSGAFDCACEVMRPPNDFPPATSFNPGQSRAASSTAARMAACATAGWSGRPSFFSM